ncbi:MAG TPA: S-methyl-5-thioribose-1-phosphate isomerase [Candidatus Sumerlaeota bacterium]|nr:MAG: Methylthioribose-1-phosphate isomerase [candidate division BRC1 bacterium ADurb.Bin183]HOE63270.1 S-methyl-5-thioribose-1-phosphate isomerase [Candidatus Sumerlaeota bacterium]HRR29858.1 S-methyl-5-thioribose-1-phosphate isomerase [Candidatus Sumerlaeia bacterium]HON50628.1 S-methyl-5-thioribose-1-phosphate isomerase [Candidatus Sumerlaeota bacterium]HOR65450.1 S-methyl-5-thioribose-1-phosphate isomerase [Candidatus Sumerlaeota bacterium]
MPVDSICWKAGACRIIDQTLLPEKLRYLKLTNIRDMWEAIRHLRVRGAPALGIAAAYGLYLGIRDSKSSTFSSFMKDLNQAADYLKTSRPTAINLFWALERMKQKAEDVSHLPIASIKQSLLDEAHRIWKEDYEAGVAMGDAGAALIPDGASILTHCNAGGLASASYGSALAVVYRAAESGKKIKVYADETRPLLQGARLTAWELSMNKIPVTVICDNMAGYLMSLKKIDAVFVGADRITASGDFANKIGTYSVAVLAHAHRIPFYVVAPLSSFDISIKTGGEIPIEERPHEEIQCWRGRQIIPTAGVDVFNPAFDVTPHGYVTAFVTEKGVINPPYHRTINRLFRSLHDVKK